MIRELVRKDLKLFLTDRKGVIVSIAVPIALASFMAIVFGGMSGGRSDGRKMAAVPTAFVDQDQSALSKALTAELSSAGLIELRTMSAEDAQAAVRSGKIGSALILPRGFGEQAAAALLGGVRPKLTVLYDPSKMAESQIVRGALMQGLMQMLARKASGGSDPPRAPFELVEEAVTADGVPDRDRIRRATVGHAFVGMALQGVLFFAIEAAMGLMRDRNRGIWRRFRAAPLSKTSLLAARVLSAGVISAVILVIVLAFGIAAFQVRVGGSVVGFVLVLLTTALMAATLGLLIATLGKTEQQTRGLAIFGVLIMIMLSGAWMPSFMMPKAMQSVGLVLPARWAIDGLDAMTWRGVGLSGALLPAGMLLLYSCAFCLLARWRFKWD